MTKSPEIVNPQAGAAAADPDGPGAGSAAEGAVRATSVDQGVATIRSYLRSLRHDPGVYRMLNGAGDVLYVGKAKSLRRRVTSYTNLARQPVRIQRMVAETRSMEFVTTHTEAEALLLEANLIKRYAPRYNILLRDDKSFPSIRVTHHDFPQVLKHRGARNKDDEYFGPFASAWAVNETLNVLQRAFLLRTCTDAIFAARTRPCLLFQIKRCSAPCVGRISATGYADLVDQARGFLAGDDQKIQRRLADEMQRASDELRFEEAAEYRDRIRAMAQVQARQDINFARIGDADVVAAHGEGGQVCVQVFFFRAGRNYGNRAFFPIQTRDATVEEVLEAFVGQFYAARTPPGTVFLSHRLPNQDLVAEALGVRAERKVGLNVPKRGDKRKLIDHALVNARAALARRQGESASQRRLMEGIQDLFGLDGPPERIEVYDNSHVSGTKAVGAMVVAGPEGPIKQAYRKFNIKGDFPAEGGDEFSPGDDYAMMREVLTRRFSRALREDPDRTRNQWPDLVLIDGGQGQLNVALEVFADLGVEDVTVAGIAKGRERNAGRERIFLPGRAPFTLPLRDPVLFYLQRLRDEAHRFAIGAHRAKRAKATTRSVLDEIPGIGAKRKKALLHHFGSARAVERAGRADLEKVAGINKSFANKIYDWFHPEG
ncbi:MAG: excinuclease ABC subunit UvrC [Hyphomicrobiales bacterium]|nr:excinuclease ABC subunit UvrC [Hyphomicrobiales bacterium]MCP5372306.1 excinuclease ABC subunit UvrC [Hyphomicrobiales bacterium]